MRDDKAGLDVDTALPVGSATFIDSFLGKYRSKISKLVDSIVAIPSNCSPGRLATQSANLLLRYCCASKATHLKGPPHAPPPDDHRGGDCGIGHRAARGRIPRAGRSACGGAPERIGEGPAEAEAGRTGGGGGRAAGGPEGEGEGAAGAEDPERGGEGRRHREPTEQRRVDEGRNGEASRTAVAPRLSEGFRRPCKKEPAPPPGTTLATMGDMKPGTKKRPASTPGKGGPGRPIVASPSDAAPAASGGQMPAECECGRPTGHLRAAGGVRNMRHPC